MNWCVFFTCEAKKIYQLYKYYYLTGIHYCPIWPYYPLLLTPSLNPYITLSKYKIKIKMKILKQHRQGLSYKTEQFFNNLVILIKLCPRPHDHLNCGTHCKHVCFISPVTHNTHNVYYFDSVSQVCQCWLFMICTNYVQVPI